MRIMHMLHALECEPQTFGSTVCNGNKWADSLGETLDLCVCTPLQSTDIVRHVMHEVKGHGIVTAIWTGEFSEIPAKFLEYEHEISSRTYSGLFRSMRRAYGDSFTPENQVTVVTYFRRD